MAHIIDAHVHLSRSPVDTLIPFARMNGLSYTWEELAGLMKTSGIARGLLLSPPLRGGSPLPNVEILKLCRESRGLLLPVLTVVPTAAGVRAALSIARKERGVKGFKVLLGYYRVFPDNRVFAPLYNHAEEEGLPVMFHTGDTADRRGSLVHSHPLTLDALANSRPGLKVIACHFGNPWIGDVGELLYKHENLFADMSGLAIGGGRYAAKYGKWLTRRLSEAIYFAGGAEKVIFGSDYPVTTYATALRLVEGLDVGAREKEGILSKNAERVFKL